MSNAHNLKPWKPGESGNPSGMPRIPDHLRSIASLTQLEVTKLVSKYARMTRKELQAAASDENIPMLEVSIASIFAQSAKNGDYQRLAFLLDRAGLRPKPVDVEDDDTGVKSMSTKDLLEIVRDSLKMEEAG